MATITVSVRQCRNLHSPRVGGESFTCFARVEHGPQSLGESEKVECGGGRGETMEVGLETSLTCNSSDPQRLNEIVQNPLLVSFLEVLPKDKKAKEEKTSVLGQVTFDLLPLLLSPTPLQLTRKLHPPQEGTEITGENAAEVDVELSVSRPILTEEQLAQSNLLTLRVRSLHSLPDTWQPGSFPFTFTLTLPLPTPSPPSLILPNGTLKPSPEKDTSSLTSHWRWPSLPSAVGPAALVQDSPLLPSALEDEAGEIRDKQDAKFRRTAECEKPRVVWNTEQRCWLPPDSATALLTQLSQCSLWPCEVGRMGIMGGGGKGKGKEEEAVLSYHAVNYINLAPLLYPGVTHICGAYTLCPFSESEIAEKTQWEYSSVLASSLAQAGSTAVGKKLGGGGGGGGGGKRAASSARLREGSVVGIGGEEGGGGEGKGEAQALVDARTYVYLEVELYRPLIPKRTASVLAERISEYIPPRPPLPRRVGGAERAVQDFHSQTASITNTLLQEYRELFGEALANGTLSESRDAVDERRQNLLFHLNSSGKYYAFKEQLKQSVVRIVRERYLTRAQFSDRDQLQSFLSELYVFLTNQMHTSMKKVLSLEDPAPPPPSVVNSDLLKHFAFEAEACRDYELADRYYKERVSQADHVPSHWYDYGVFCLLRGDSDKSEQCFKEALALDQKMIPALLLYGMLCCLDERYSEGEQFFEMATTSDPSNIIAWTMRGLFYEHAGNGVYQEMCYAEASKLNHGQTGKTFITQNVGRKTVAIATQSKASVAAKQAGNLKHPSTSSIGGGGGGGGGGVIPHVTVESSRSLASEASQKIQDQDKKATASGALSVLEEPPLGDFRKTTNTESAVSFNEVASVIVEGGGGEEGERGGVQLKGDGGTAEENSLAEPGHSELAQSSQPLASGSLVSVRSLGATSSRQDSEQETSHSIFLQTAAYLMDVHALKFAEMALAHELTLPLAGPSPQYHVAEARLLMHREEYGRAQESLRKAIAMDFQDSNAWSLLGHCLYLTGDYDGARDAYERTVLFVTPPAHTHTVYLQLADIYLRENEYEKAREMFLHACRKSPSSVTWRGVGIACYKLGDLGQAEDALCEANVLNNLDPLTWGYLTLVCLKTDRPVEAEQALKFAVKTGLCVPSLLAEVRQLQKTHCPSANLSHILRDTTTT